MRIRDDEWTVYRRYTEFRDLHQKLKKHNPIVSSYEFPPKKSIGNKVRSGIQNVKYKVHIYNIGTYITFNIKLGTILSLH